MMLFIQWMNLCCSECMWIVEVRVSSGAILICSN